MPLTLLRAIAAAGVLSLASADPVTAQALTGRSTVIATFADWRVVIGETNRGKVCYAAGSPRLRLPQGAVRERGYLFVTTRPTDAVRDEVSVEFGFEVAARATLIVGSTAFALVTDDRGAWIKDLAEEARLVAAMRANAQLTVQAVSQLGEEGTDTYSLKGFGEALDRARRECADPNSTSLLRPPGGKSA
jgi:hypothetical protein